MTEKKVKLIAFYLPQFHPTPENDEWWGKGFTEWTNVTKTQPLFDGHYQPHLPTDLGFYDLRLRETHYAQIDLAKSYGIDGFCYHYYWFSGRKLLYRPLQDMLNDPQSSMPFCLCWANETWTRRWSGFENEVLLQQDYSQTDALAFIKDIEPFLKDTRYIRIDEKPLIIVYRPQNIPDIKHWVKIWRKYCLENGLGEIHLSAALTHANNDYFQFDFDSGVEFPPHNLKASPQNKKLNFKNAHFGVAYEYAEVASYFMQKSYAKNSRIFKTVFPSWDNTARTENRATFVLSATPSNYAKWLGQTLQMARRENRIQDSLVFINAWNEWAEGCHLEPDRKFGRQYLEATSAALQGNFNNSVFETDELAQATQINSNLWVDLRNVFAKHLSSNMALFRSYINQRKWLRNFIIKFTLVMKKISG